MKEYAKTRLQALRLYEPVHRLWIHRPNLRALCINAGYRLVGAEDHLPIPPTRLIFLVTISNEVSWFLHSGLMSLNSILYVLQKNGINPGDLHNILDFGCGCGRTLRYWQSVQGPHIYGTDYNPELIAWCQRHLSRIASFSVNQSTPPLPFPDEMFDFIYAIFVFTHFTENLQDTWLTELKRILHSQGYLLMTLHGESRLGQLDADERQRFQSGQLVVKAESEAGSNYCGAFHPKQYVLDHMTRWMEVCDFLPCGQRDADQDIYLFRKPLVV